MNHRIKSFPISVTSSLPGQKDSEVLADNVTNLISSKEEEGWSFISVSFVNYALAFVTMRFDGYPQRAPK